MSVYWSRGGGFLKFLEWNVSYDKMLFFMSVFFGKDSWIHRHWWTKKKKEGSGYALSTGGGGKKIKKLKIS